MRYMAIICIVLSLCGCAASASVAARGCRPTGWVDRIEGLWVVIEPDDETAEILVLPTSCFSESIRGGVRIVQGRIDIEATEELRREMDRTTARLLNASSE
jgi:hypothetical protein